MKNTVVQIITAYLLEHDSTPQFSYIQRILHERGEPQISRASFYRYLAEVLEQPNAVAEKEGATMGFQYIKEFYTRAEMLELKAYANSQIHKVQALWQEDRDALQAEIKRLKETS